MTSKSLRILSLTVDQLETTVYTSCGRCRKPLIHPAPAGPALTTTPTSNAVPRGIKSTTIEKPRGNYAFCNKCKEATTKCSIWLVIFLVVPVPNLTVLFYSHLPVRALLFKCPVCMHGGHHECYSAYYARIPMVSVPKVQPPSMTSKQTQINASSSPSSQPATRERRMSRSGEPGSVEDGEATSSTEGQSEPGVGVRDEAIMGRPCAAGCGHFCWAANEGLYARPDL